MRREPPRPYRRVRWRDAVILYVALAVGVFLMTWMGYKNCGYGACWGDAIPLAVAVARLPLILLVIFCAFVLLGLVAGIRVGNGPD